MKDIDFNMPEKNIDIIGYDTNNEKHYIFRCNCKNPNCLKWRCSITGYEIFVKIIKWEMLS